MAGNQIYETVSREYERIRYENTRKLEQKKLKLYDEIPRLAEIEKEINLLGFQISKAILKAKNKQDAQNLINEIKNKTDLFVNERKNILMRNGVPENYLSPIYNCEKCKDTGLTENGKKCNCYAQKYIKALCNFADLTEISKEENFQNFDLNYYSKQIDENEGNISPYDNMKKNLDVCLGFCENFGKQFNNLIFFGNSGLGKTFLCSAISNRLINKGVDVIYIGANSLFKMVESEKFGKNEGDSDSDIIEMLMESELLIIDDLGAEFSSTVTSAALFDIINNRLNLKKPTIISTNLKISEMKNKYSERNVSRFYGEYTLLRFFGDDIRIKKRLGN